MDIKKIKERAEGIDHTSENADLVKDLLGVVESLEDDVEMGADDQNLTIRDLEDEVEELNRQLDAVPDELRDFSSLMDSTGIRPGVQRCLEVALTHAQQNFGWHTQETKAIEALLELAKP